MHPDRFFCKLHEQRDMLLGVARAAEASIAADVRASGSGAPKRTIWQRSGVHRGETELEMNARVRSSELEAVSHLTLNTSPPNHLT